MSFFLRLRFRNETIQIDTRNYLREIKHNHKTSKIQIYTSIL